MNSFTAFLRAALIDFLEYQTPKIVHIKDKRIGVLNRFIQLSIVLYVICYAIVWKKGYQEFDYVESSVTSKVKGVAFTNFSEDQFKHFINESMREYYNRVWDVSDYIVPPEENNAFFVTTNLIITPNQKLGICPEDPSLKTAHCDPLNNTCVDGKTDLFGNGAQTGECVLSDREESVHVCQIRAWCPVERDELPLKNKTALLAGTKNSTVLIKNSIKFSKFGVSLRNILKTTNETYLKKCRYNAFTDPQCPVFVLNDIVKAAGQDYDEISKSGAVIGIEITWNCNLDFTVDYCVPVYSFRRLDEEHSMIAPGWNYRYSHYYSDRERTLFKATGIKFSIIVNGQAGKLNFVPLFVNIGSGLGLLAITTIICDFIALYLTSAKKYYKEKKYLYVESVCNGEDVEPITVRKRSNVYETQAN
ncbi:P2X purinoceptor 4-like protein [Dinothrombium tinctorium]|uniref:P2X purinoceptor 4-like protein n=1 Tax=Dinothrombium tinctorium TaxID=1965070 RepID=A0A3S3NI74_9ACAR|nr:P2X purinoceptor 4-like protein [Dinothrombium tinctorium]